MRIVVIVHLIVGLAVLLRVEEDLMLHVAEGIVVMVKYALLVVVVQLEILMYVMATVVQHHARLRLQWSVLTWDGGAVPEVIVDQPV